MITFEPLFIEMIKLVKQLPNLITLGNLFCGCIAIVQIFSGQIQIACLLIFLAAFLDFCDGLVARALNAHSPIGGQLDSFADAVTFGVAPGMILFRLLAWAFAQKTNALDTNVAFFYPAFLVAICGVIRLARFNITEGKPDRFSGVPIPAMALFVACLPMIVLYDNHPQISTYILNTNVLYGLIALLSWLMISKEQLFKLSPKALDFKKNLMRWIFLGLALISIILLKWSAALVLLPLYWLCPKIEFSFLNKTEE